jgi:hypothetical protein
MRDPRPDPSQNAEKVTRFLLWAVPAGVLHRCMGVPARVSTKLGLRWALLAVTSCCVNVLVRIA